MLLLQAAAPCPCSGWLDPAPAAPVSVQQLSCGEGSTAQGPHLQGICWEELLLMPAFTQMDTLCVGCGLCWAMKTNKLLQQVKGSKVFELKPGAEAELSMSGAELIGKMAKAFSPSGFGFIL